MRDANPIHTLGDYSRPIHEGYMNTIELPEGINVDFLKLVDSLDLDVANRERTCMRLFQFSLRDQAINWLERLQAGSISTCVDLTTRFLAQFFPPGRTAKLCNDILMLQQHQGESLSEAWTRFKDLLQKCKIDRAVDRKLRDKNADEYWEIIENLALYDHEGWNDSSDSVKPVKAISTPQSTPKTPDRRLLELKDQINFLLKGSRPTPRPSSTHVPQPYAEAVYLDPHPRNLNEPPKMERFENAIFKQREEINNRMTEMFGLLKELTTNKAPEKEAEKENEAENGAKNEPIKSAEKELTQAKEKEVVE
ncbi:zinc finger, CCHC-type containing protein, partial [Tanacetum coccineum]